MRAAITLNPAHFPVWAGFGGTGLAEEKEAPPSPQIQPKLQNGLDLHFGLAADPEGHARHAACPLRRRSCLIFNHQQSEIITSHCGCAFQYFDQPLRLRPSTSSLASPAIAATLHSNRASHHGRAPQCPRLSATSLLSSLTFQQPHSSAALLSSNLTPQQPHFPTTSTFGELRQVRQPQTPHPPGI